MVSPGSRLERHFFVFARFQQAQRHAFHADLEDLAAAADHGRQGAGVGHHDAARGGVPQQHAQRDVARFHFALHQRVVERLQQLGGPRAGAAPGCATGRSSARRRAPRPRPCR